jgi:hypothetical protein
VADFPGLIGGSGTNASAVLDAEETINYIVEKAQSKYAQNPDGVLLPTPGFTVWGAATQAGSRGFIYAADRFLAVVGSRLFEFDVNATVTDRGPVALDANPALLVYNRQGAQVGIASGGSIYVFNLTTNVLSAALLSGTYTHIAFAGGYGFAFQLSTGKTLVGALNDLSTWDPATFFQRSLFADPAQCIFADENNLIWTLGTETFEARYNSGTGTQPWIPMTGLVGPYGIASPFGYGLSPSGNFWVTRNAAGIGRFVVSVGGQPAPVGTYAIDAQIDKFATSTGISDAEVLVYDQGGHTAAIVAMAAAQTANPSVPCTFAYDVEGKTWSKRGRWNAQKARWELWAPRCHVVAFGGKHLVGDRSSGTIWLLDQTSATDIDGNGTRRIRRTPHLNKEHQRRPVDLVEVLTDIIGPAVQAPAQGSDPQLTLKVSRDGGKTYGNERRCGIGRIGETKRRCFWTQLGAPMDLVYEFGYSEPVPAAIVGGYLNNTEPVVPARGSR